MTAPIAAPRAAYNWFEDSGVAAIQAVPDFDAAAAEARALAEADRDALTAAAEAARQLPEVAEAARLAALLEDATREKAAAEAKRADALGQARQLLRQGQDPGRQETRAERAGRKAEALAGRETELRRLCHAARQKAGAA